MDVVNKVTGDTLEAVEFNQSISELQNVIEGENISLANNDLNQLGKALANKSTTGNFYTDSGSPNTYILSSLSQNQNPTAYRNGMTVRFVASNTNTGASTIDVTGLGVKAIKYVVGRLPNVGDTLVTPANMVTGYIIVGNTYEAIYNGTDFIIRDLSSNKVMNSFITVSTGDFTQADIASTTSGRVPFEFIEQEYNNTRNRFELLNEVVQINRTIVRAVKLNLTIRFQFTQWPNNNGNNRATVNLNPSNVNAPGDFVYVNLNKDWMDAQSTSGGGSGSVYIDIDFEITTSLENNANPGLVTFQDVNLAFDSCIYTAKAYLTVTAISESF